SRGTLTEFPPATVQIGSGTFPSAGGGYLRILPFWYTQWSLRRLAHDDGRAIVVYFHPWELDPDQPRIQARMKSRFRHYTNLQEMEPRLRRLMRAYPFQTFHDLVSAGLTSHQHIP